MHACVCACVLCVQSRSMGFWVCVGGCARKHTHTHTHTHTQCYLSAPALRATTSPDGTDTQMARSRLPDPRDNRVSHQHSHGHVLIPPDACFIARMGISTVAINATPTFTPVPNRERTFRWYNGHNRTNIDPPDNAVTFQRCMHNTSLTSLTHRKSSS